MSSRLKCDSEEHIINWTLYLEYTIEGEESEVTYGVTDVDPLGCSTEEVSA